MTFEEFESFVKRESEIGDIFVSDMSFGIGIFYPVASCVGAEKDYHMC